MYILYNISVIYIIYIYHINIISYYAQRPHGKREIGLVVFEVAAVEHVMMEVYLPTGKTVANHDSFCVSETAAEARRQTMR